MKHVIITGSSSGIGLGLAKEFLKKGFTVTISGRNEKKLLTAYDNLINNFQPEFINKESCNVRNCAEIENLWLSGFNKFGRVDIWINNAGIGQDYINVIEMDEISINSLIDINIKGLIQSSRIVLNKMEEQGFGAIYNMEGFGSDGRKMAKLSIYGTTKSAITYFTKSLIKETKGSSILIGLISPGMVITDLFLKPVYRDAKEAKQFLKIANILADKVETVTPWLVDKMIKNTKHGKSFNWLSNIKVLRRFTGSLLNKRSLLSEKDIKLG